MTRPATPRRRRRRAARLALTLTACSGFAAMALEVLWSRTLQHWTAALVTSFAVLLAVYLAALALGALATRRIADRVASRCASRRCLLGVTGVSALCRSHSRTGGATSSVRCGRARARCGA